MELLLPQYRRLDALIAPFRLEPLPDWREFNRENADALLALLTRLLSALCLAENLRHKKSMRLPAERSHLAGGGKTVDWLNNVHDHLQSFTTQVLNLSKTERQTFAFIIENVVDYLNASADSPDRSALFADYRFWIENFFKFVDAKIAGEVDFLSRESLPPLSASGGGDGEAVFRMAAGGISLFPFAAGRRGQTWFLDGLRGEALVFSHPLREGTAETAHPAYQLPLAEFLLANFDFVTLEALRAPIAASDDPLLKRWNSLRLGYQHHQQKAYQESLAALSEAGYEEFNLPLVYLLQIKNLIPLNRSFEVKRLLQKFLLLFPAYAEGNELMGDLHLREENFELAIGFYEKALALGSGRGFGEKLKRAREGLEKTRKGAPETQKNEVFSDLSESALETDLPVLGRERELRQLLEILISSTRRNVLLVGDRGSGKSALLRLLARRLLFEEVPATLRGKRLKEINFVALLTGSKYRGQFEEKALKMLQEFRGQNAILVLEDIHLMMSSGTARGTSLDLVNILKSFLRENSIQVVATTDYEEFKNTLEKDNSLLGHFQKVTVNELSAEETLQALKNLAAATAAKDRVQVPPAVLERIAEAAKRDIRDRRLPDSAVRLFERAVAKARLRNGERPTECTVTEEDVAEVLADLLNLPDTHLSLSLRERLADLDRQLHRRIIGQDPALEAMIAGVTAAKLGFAVKKNRPNGVFLFIGPTGVGKTETALALSEALYGSQDFLIRIDMSEYMEKFTYSRFVGAAPGYVGYYDSNQLTDRVRQNPFSIILLDEIEKADSQLLNIFLQVFDAGRLTDARGNVVDFSKTTVIMTSNIGTSLFSKPHLGYQGSLEGGGVSQATLIKALKRYFSPEFLNRIDEIIVFSHLHDQDVRQIIQLHLEEVRRDLARQNKELQVSDGVLELIARRGYSLEYGARNLARAIRKQLLEKLGRLALEKEWEEARLVSCRLGDGEVQVDLVPVAVNLASRDEWADSQKG